MIDNFKIITGFSDILPFFKKTFPDRKGMFKLSKLGEDLLGIQVTENFHDAVFDVNILHQFVQFICKKRRII